MLGDPEMDDFSSFMADDHKDIEQSKPKCKYGSQVMVVKHPEREHVGTKLPRKSVLQVQLEIACAAVSPLLW